MSDKERQAIFLAVTALAIAADAQANLHRRDRWKRRIKDALWPIL